MSADDQHVLVAKDDGVVTLANLKFVDRLNLQANACHNFKIDTLQEHLEQIDFSPSKYGMFLARDNQSVKLWSLGDQRASPIQTIWEENHEKLYRISHGSFSPHDDYMVAYAAKSKGIFVHDSRSARCVYEMPSECNNFARIKWSPYIPYWLACSSERGIEILDLRYTSKSPCQILPMAFVSDVIPHCNDQFG